jgi:hypothetical protein
MSSSAGFGRLAIVLLLSKIEQIEEVCEVQSCCFSGGNVAKPPLLNIRLEGTSVNRCLPFCAIVIALVHGALMAEIYYQTIGAG